MLQLFLFYSDSLKKTFLQLWHLRTFISYWTRSKRQDSIFGQLPAYTSNFTCISLFSTWRWRLKMQQWLQIDSAPPMKGTGQIQCQSCLKNKPPPSLTVLHKSLYLSEPDVFLCKMKKYIRIPWRGEVKWGKSRHMVSEKAPRRILMRTQWRSQVSFTFWGERIS